MARMDPEQYRSKARHYLVRARQMTNPANRATLIDLASIWMRMADRAKFRAQELTPPTGGFLKDEAFQSEQVDLMGDVFEDVLHTLGLVDREDPITRMVAKKVIELAQAGERDPVRLKQLTLAAFEGRPN